jgi:PPOX class probable FMN-dependent enzyme
LSGWIEQFESDLREQFDAGPKIVTLATVDGDQPDARIIVLRQLTGEGDIVFTSDARSGKNAQLQANPNATIVAWLPKLKRQCRLQGRIEILEAADTRRRQKWESSSDASRTMFFWPPPGSEFNAATSNAPEKITANAAMPDSFSVLVFHPLLVDTLDLTTQPHTRTRWSIHADEWRSIRINP